MSQSRIRTLLEGRLNTWAGSRSPALPIAWQNVAITPADTYLRAFIIPAQTDSTDLKGDLTTYIGIFQVSIITLDGIGPQLAESIAEELQTLFPANLLLTSASFTVQTTTPFSIGPEFSGADSYVLPVTTQYRADDI